MNAAQKRFAKDLSRRTDVPVHVTSGTRPPLQQAQAVASLRYKRGDASVRALYAQKDLIDEVLAKDKSDTAGMAKVLEKQVRRGRFLSRHMRGDAIDLRTNNLTSAQVATLTAAVRAMGAKALLEPDHLHVERITGAADKVTEALLAAGIPGGIVYTVRRIPWWGWAAGGAGLLLLIGASRRRRPPSRRRLPPPERYPRDPYY